MHLNGDIVAILSTQLCPPLRPLNTTNGDKTTCHAISDYNLWCDNPAPHPEFGRSLEPYKKIASLADLNDRIIESPENLGLHLGPDQVAPVVAHWKNTRPSDQIPSSSFLQTSATATAEEEPKLGDDLRVFLNIAFKKSQRVVDHNTWAKRLLPKTNLESEKGKLIGLRHLLGNDSLDLPEDEYESIRAQWESLFGSRFLQRLRRRRVSTRKSEAEDAETPQQSPKRRRILAPAKESTSFLQAETQPAAETVSAEPADDCGLADAGVGATIEVRFF